MDNEKWFVPENLILPLNADDKEDAIMQLGDLLYRNGYVKETFTPAVLARESCFATGLPTKIMGIAIPHTDSIHVNKRAIAVGILSKPVRFCIMGDLEDTETDVSLIMMLAVPDKKDVMTVLEQVMGIIKRENFLKDLSETQDREKILMMLDKELNASTATQTEEKPSEETNVPLSVTLTINHPVGLHARPASVFVKTASQFNANIQVTNGNKKANAKSILSVLTLGAGKGAVITITAEGEQAEEALAALKELVESNFGGID